MLRAALLAVVLSVATADTKSDVTAYFKKNFPHKADKLDGILAQYAGKEDKLMAKLVFEATQLKVHAHYTKYKPKALESVGKIVEANVGKEKELLAGLAKKEKEIANWRKKIFSAYKSMGTPPTLINEQVDSALQKWYNREGKLLKTLQKEGASGGGDADNASDDGGGGIFGGFLDLIFMAGLAGLVYVAVTVVMPMAAARDGPEEKAKKAKKEKGGHNGSTKKKR